MKAANAARQNPSPAFAPEEAQLRAAAAAYRAAADGALHVYPTGELDTLGSHACAAFFFTPDNNVTDNFGYGATPLEAEVGALGELMEDLRLEQALATVPLQFRSFDAMVAEHGGDRVLDPLTLCLPAGSDYASTQEIAWIEVESADRSHRVFTPFETIACSDTQFNQRVGDCGITPLFMPLTSGSGAGTSREMALAHSILELLQRDGNCTEFRAMDRGIVIDPAGIEDSGVQALLDHLHRHGVRPIIKLASTQFGITNVYVVGGGDRVNFPLQQTACGEAADVSPARAIRKALLEFIAARCRKAFMHGPIEPIANVTTPQFVENILQSVSLAAQESRSMTEMLRWIGKDESDLLALMRQRVFAENDRIAFADLPTAEADASPAERLRDITSRLAAENLPVYYFDAWNAEHPDVFTTKAVIPHLECETMSYHRIGERGTARLLARQSPLIARSATHEGCKRIRLTAAAEERLGGPCWFDAAIAESIVGDLYPLYREPSSLAVQRHLRERVA